MTEIVSPISRAQFDRFCLEGYQRVPVAATYLADMETPLTAYLKLAQGPSTY